VNFSPLLTLSRSRNELLIRAVNRVKAFICYSRIAHYPVWMKLASETQIGRAIALVRRAASKSHGVSFQEAASASVTIHARFVRLEGRGSGNGNGSASGRGCVSRRKRLRGIHLAHTPREIARLVNRPVAGVTSRTLQCGRGGRDPVQILRRSGHYHLKPAYANA